MKIGNMMRLQEFNDYKVTETEKFENSDFYKWFMKSLSEGKFDKGYVSKWDLFRNKVE